MADYIIINGDIVQFNPTFGNAIVVPQPGTMEGSGSSKNSDNKICLEGDEGNVSVAGCMYTAPPYVIPGTGTLKIDSLASDQLTTKVNNDDTAIILKGSTFTAKFEVQSPAMQPTPSGATSPDSNTQYTGTGLFITINTTLKAS